MSFLCFGGKSLESSLSDILSRARDNRAGEIDAPTVDSGGASLPTCCECKGPAYRSSFSRNKDVSLRRGFDFEGCKNPRRSRD